MPTYHIKSGDMSCKIKTPNQADALTLACLAVDKNMPKSPGMIVEVAGGQFKGGGEVYVSFEQVAKLLGRWG